MQSASLKKRLILLISLSSVMLFGFNCPGMNPWAMFELHLAGMDKYVGQFEPATSEDLGDWTKHTFDPDGGDGPLCIDGSPLTAFTQIKNPKKVVVFLNGGGACWQDFYACTIQADVDPPFASGIFADSFDDGGAGIDNPLGDWSKVYVSYCDGSVFSGDNEVVDANFPNGPVRYHRGVRNMTAALDLARDTFPQAKKLLLAGSSAGGFGVGAYAPSVARFVFPPSAKLMVFNDSGPVVANLDIPLVNQIRENDWQSQQFIPASCTDCGIDEQPANFLSWTLENDAGYRGSLYSTDGDAVIRFFLGFLSNQAYRDLLTSVHDPINAAFPDRYKRFIRSGSSEHTNLRGDLFYTGEANGVPIYQWMDDFVNRNPGWVDIVEDFVPAP